MKIGKSNCNLISEIIADTMEPIPDYLLSNRMSLQVYNQVYRKIRMPIVTLVTSINWDIIKIITGWG